jgi:two-component system phosphate regulon sensor histidine kinase PhoR
LRTPLSIFQGYLETLLENPELPAGEAHPMLEVMRKHSKRLNALVEDLLILARLEARDEQFQFAPVVVDRFIQGAVADWSLRSGDKKIELTAELAPGLPEIRADSFRLEQVLSNLIDNAIKYTEPGGQVKVRASSVNGAVEIRVEDTGIGIPAADLPRIFERFYRADKARSRERGGTGLGLSIVKHIVLAHGGTVSAESQQGHGTSIIIRLPVDGQATSAATPPAA